MSAEAGVHMQQPVRTSCLDEEAVVVLLVGQTVRHGWISPEFMKHCSERTKS
jgi:hypothetical protein